MDVFPDDAPQHPGHVPKVFIQIEHTLLRDLFPAEGEQLTGERRGPLGGAFDFAKFRNGRVILGHAQQNHVAVTNDRQQHVIKVVSDASRKFAHSLHFERLLELAL